MQCYTPAFRSRFLYFGRPFINKMNNEDPKIDPCETHLLILSSFENLIFNLTIFTKMRLHQLTSSLIFYITDVWLITISVRNNQKFLQNRFSQSISIIHCSINQKFGKFQFVSNTFELKFKTNTFEISSFLIP